MNYGIEKFHPLISLLFFISALLFGMFYVHPIFIAVSIFTSTFYFFILKGKKGIKIYLSLFIVFMFISIFNPIFNSSGNRVLFTYFNNRAFTLEGLLYGFSTAGIFLSVIIWFSCYNYVMTEDKFIYVFGKTMPSVSLILSMTFRLIPEFKYKLLTIASARRCIGKGSDLSLSKFKNSTDIISVLTSYSLENSVITADSMKSRGFLTGIRSNYSIYNISVLQIWILLLIIILNTIIVICSLYGGTYTVYNPGIKISFSVFTYLGATAYTILLSIPSVLHISEDVRCRILKSKI